MRARGRDNRMNTHMNSKNAQDLLGVKPEKLPALRRGSGQKI